MGKMKELDQILDEMIVAGEQMIEAASSIKKYFSEDDLEIDQTRFAEPVTSSAEKKVNEEVADPPENQKSGSSGTSADVKQEKPGLTKEDVRKLLVEKSALEESKYKEQVKALVRKYSETGNLGGISPERYEALIAELEAIGNA